MSGSPRSGEPVYYDGDIVQIVRVKNADFSGDGVVGFADFGSFAVSFGSGSGGPADFDEDGIVGLADFGAFCSAYGKCVNESDTIYNLCP